MKEFNEIDELFGNAFADFQQTPPDGVKAEIDEKLFSSAADSKKKKGYGYFGFGFLMMIAFLAVNLSVRFELSARNTSEYTNSINSIEKIEDQSNILSDSKVNAPSNKNKSKDRESMNRSISMNQDDLLNENNTLKSIDNWTLKGKRTKKNVDRNGTEGKEYAKGTEKVSESLNLDRLESPFDSQTSESSSKTLGNDNGINTTESKHLEELSENTDTLKINEEENEHDPQENELPTLARNTKLGHSFQLYTGGAYAMNSLRNAPGTSSLKAVGPTIEIGGEINFGLNSRLSLMTGVGYQSSKETYSETNLIITDSTLITTIDTVFNPVTQQYDSIINTYYEYIESETLNSQTVRINSFELPVYANWMINKESNYEISISGGIRLAYNQMKIVESNNLASYAAVNTFGLSVMVRPQFVYYFGKVGLGAYFRYATDIIPVTDYQGLQRSRQLFGGGILFRIGL